jgi:hypothetical protein
VNFLRANSGVLIALVDVKRIFAAECADKSARVMALMRDGEILELSRDYNIESIRRVLDPCRNGSAR